MAKYVGAIDQGTSSTRFALFDVNGNMVDYASVDLDLLSPKPGWAEHDPLKILSSVQTCATLVMSRGYNAKDVSGIGISNQRETTILWDKVTGFPLYNAILWMDVRNSDLCAKIESANIGGKNAFRASCGLPISTYFSAMKIRWLIQNCPNVRKAIIGGRCAFGTVDTWLIWNMTGGILGGRHLTDVTNASRTMLMNIDSLAFDKNTCKALGIPMEILPGILSNSEDFGRIFQGELEGLHICGCLGDQHAAMVGQLCLKPGQAKNTYGTGAFMMFNTGAVPIPSKHGLLTTVCAKLGRHSPCSFALEGSIAVAGSAIQWLRDKLHLISSASQVNELADRVKDNGGVYFVTAFGGLFAPHWRDDARGTIVGLTQYCNREHLARAALEAVCFRTREVCDAMVQDSGVPLHTLRVDGGMSASNLMLQIQANVLGVEVQRPEMLETSSLGAAIAAGLYTGFWSSIDDVSDHITTSTTFTFVSNSYDKHRMKQAFGEWQRAIQVGPV